MSTTRKLKQERPNRKSSPRKRDVRPNGVAQKHPRRLSVGDSTSTSTISADGEGRRRYLTAALFFCPRLADSLSFAAFRPGFFRHSGGSSSPSIGDSLVQHVQECAGFRRDQPCDPFPGSTPPYVKQRPFPPLLR